MSASSIGSSLNSPNVLQNVHNLDQSNRGNKKFPLMEILESETETPYCFPCKLYDLSAKSSVFKNVSIQRLETFIRYPDET